MRLFFIISFFLAVISLNGQTINIPDQGWHLWPDTAARWQNDKLYLPDEVNLDALPANPPTGGWRALNEQNGITIKLPATVEQFYWGKFGYSQYKEAYYFENSDEQVKDGSYRGVSWWWKEIEIPATFKNKQVTLFIRGARLRAEVYLNKKLVGYNIITETSFTCDLTAAIRPGEKNQLAIRITNPGGRFDWLDTKLMSWGDYRFHASHGFGGLDRGIVMRAHDEVFIKDLWVLNTPAEQTVRAHLLLENRTDQTKQGTLSCQIREHRNGKIVLTTPDAHFILPPRSAAEEVIEMHHDNARLWSLSDPNLYELKAHLTTKSDEKDKRNQVFGFRWFEADGIDRNAVLRLNDQRIRLTSAISWGFWGLNGLWPLPKLAEKEVRAAKSFGMNCINFHRNIGKAEVLDAQDRLGLLRFMEPGGGQTALGDTFSLYAPSPENPPDLSGIDGSAQTFAEKYMEAKILAMIRDHRSHPSLIIYNIQNEIHPDLQNPRIYNLLRKMHDLDPSRIITLKSGIPPRNQAWMQPYSDSIRVDRGDGYSGWWDQHTVGGPGVWRDELYENPDKFTHRSQNDKEIVTWGEMLGAAVSDNHQLMIKQIKEMGGKSYDLTDHLQIDSAYNAFLDRWQFRDAFPTTADLYKNIGNKCYDFWGRVIESARLAEANDFFVISGWESTAIENHSGLLDNLRNFKGDPDLLKKRLAPYRLVIKPRKLVCKTGVKDTVDLFLLNETNRPHTGRVKLRMYYPDGQKQLIGDYPLPAYQTDRFVYPVADKVITPELNQPGWYVLELRNEQGIYTKDSILVVNPKTVFDDELIIGVSSAEPALMRTLAKWPGLRVKPFQTGQDFDLLLVSDRLLHGWRSEVSADRQITNTEDDILYHTESWGYYRNLEYTFTDLPADTARVTLYLAEVTLKNQGDRVMNVAINGQTVLEDFDIVATVGGPNIAFDTTFTIPVQDKIVKITVPKLTTNYAKFSAIKVVAGDTTIAVNCGGPAYTDADGLTWEPYQQQIHLDDDIIKSVKQGASLLLLPDGAEAAHAYGRLLSQNDLLTYRGHVGKTRASWMGSWYFVRRHPVFDGLPADQAMKSYYQTPVQQTDGLLVGGEQIEVFAGYGRDHDCNIGAASFLVTDGESKIMLHTLPGLVDVLRDSNGGMHPVISTRILTNSIRHLLK